MSKIDSQTKKQVIEGLRKHRGAIGELAKRHKCTLTWVQQVFDKDAKDDDLVLLASEMLLALEMERKQKMEKAQANLLAVKNLFDNKAELATA